MIRFAGIVACALAATALLAQSESASGVQGSVRDSRGAALNAVTVQLKTGGHILTAVTNTQGIYRFSNLSAGSFTVQASQNGSGEADVGPFELAPSETKNVDLTLVPAPQFFDQPTFIVAGVADPSLRGGHGSDPVLRSAETLAKETASLRQDGTRPASADSLRQAIAREPNRADLHHALADAEESLGNPLEAAREYQRAAELDPSEANLFDWGADLLRHRAADQAVEVFSNGNRRYPRSTRALLGLAVALYSRGNYDQAARRFFEAADLDPSDPTPYLFLGKISSGAITESDGFAARIERFAHLHPQNAWANYYYAASLWKHWTGADDTATLAKVQTLLEKALSLDPMLGPALLQLGIVFAEQNNLPKAISAYQSAIQATPSMEEAHYRLALAYRKTGDPEKAQKEMELYQQLSQKSAQALERERAEIQQFVFELRGQK